MCLHCIAHPSPFLVPPELSPHSSTSNYQHGESGLKPPQDVLQARVGPGLSGPAWLNLMISSPNLHISSWYNSSSTNYCVLCKSLVERESNTKAFSMISASNSITHPKSAGKPLVMPRAICGSSNTQRVQYKVMSRGHKTLPVFR